MKRITVAEVEYVAFRLAKELMAWDEPIPAFGSRFPNVLESCLAAPFQSFAGKSPHKGLAGKAAMLFYLMIKNHPFMNGNKRIAMTTLFYFWVKSQKRHLVCRKGTDVVPSVRDRGALAPQLRAPAVRAAPVDVHSAHRRKSIDSRSRSTSESTSGVPVTGKRRRSCNDNDF